MNVTEINIEKNQYFLLAVTDTSQTADKIEIYRQNMNLASSNVDVLSPFCHVLTGDFSSRFSQWFLGDINTRVVKELDFLTSTTGYTQFIDKSINLFNGVSSCIHLIFCNKRDFDSK